MAHATKKTVDAQAVQIPADSGWHFIAKFGAIVGIAGIIVTMVAGGDGGMFGYLTGFLFWLSVALGGLFFVLFQFLTRAAWSVVVRRIAENMAYTVPVFALLFIPIVLNLDELYTWTTPELFADDAITSELLAHKTGYLNVPFFLVRAVLFFAVWTGLAWYFRSRSVKQDETGDGEITRKLQMYAAPAIALCALSTTFAAFDWNMSLDWAWFSTMYGVFFFAGSMVAAMAMIGIVALQLTEKGYMGGAVNTEHFHDIGKLLWGFMVFWAYISFSQFILIWYANIPEETMWFQHRWDGSWKYVSIALAVGHFWLPFFLFMSRHTKRSLRSLKFFAFYMLALHWVDLLWQVLPNRDHGGIHFGLAEITGFVGVGGVFLAAFAYIMTRSATVPHQDPRLPESLAFQNF